VPGPRCPAPKLGWCTKSRLCGANKIETYISLSLNRISNSISLILRPLLYRPKAEFLWEKTEAEFVSCKSKCKGKCKVVPLLN
jgi:hypothetical protein